METPIQVLSQLRLADGDAPIRSLASVDQEVQPDLLYMDSVLVSTGMNSNDDVFLPAEMWIARKSPVLKPVDWEHNTGREVPAGEASAKTIIEDNQIIGVMYNSFATTKDGTVIDENIASASDFEIPSSFDIVNQAVIYKYLYPKAAARIAEQAKAGKLFVSMEAWFNNYDYKVGNLVIARNENTAFLDNHLRANGGDGTFSGQSVGRVLRNIVFGGIGIVANPANKDSVIKSITNASLKEDVAESLAQHAIAEIKNNEVKPISRQQEVIEVMSEQDTTPVAAQAISSDDYKEVIKKLVKAEHTIDSRDGELAEAKAKIDELEKNIDGLASAFVSGSEDLSDVLGAEAAKKLADAAPEEFFSVLAEAVSAKLSADVAMAEELKTAKAELESIKAEQRAAARESLILETLAEMNGDMWKDKEKKKKAEEKAKKMAKSTQDLSDEDFDKYLEDTKELLGLAAVTVVAPADEASASDEGVTDTDVRDGVQATASISAGTEDLDVSDISEKYMTLAKTLLTAGKKNEEASNGTRTKPSGLSDLN